MVKIKPFKGLRPPIHLVEHIACRPYDVLSSKDAISESIDNEMSFYHISKPEINFTETINENDKDVIAQGVHHFKQFQEKGWLIQDNRPCYYLYSLSDNSHTQYGFVVTCNCNEYDQGLIKKNELTLEKKEYNRYQLIKATRAHLEPVFLMYEKNEFLETYINKYCRLKPLYNFTSKIDRIQHTLWKIDDKEDIENITASFSKIPYLYIADGHHRTAAAAKIAKELRQNTQDDSEFNHFTAVCFSKDQLKLYEYNRALKDICNFSEQEFIDKLKTNFSVSIIPNHLTSKVFPLPTHQFLLYFKENSYLLKAFPHTFSSKDVVENLDVNIASKYIFDQLLGITDLRNDTRIDFAGGRKGFDLLTKKVDLGIYKCALALSPISIDDIITISNLNKVLPPKATWFEPKLESGLIIHKF